MTAHLPRDRSIIRQFVTCLESLPSLHTLEIGWTDDRITTDLKNVLRGIPLNSKSGSGLVRGVKFPQIKTLILPPAAYPLLRHCCGVEGVICVVAGRVMEPFYAGFLESLGSKRDSQVKRLAIPLAAWDDPSRK